MECDLWRAENLSFYENCRFFKVYAVGPVFSEQEALPIVSRAGDAVTKRRMGKS